MSVSRTVRPGSNPRGELLHLQGLEANYRRALKGLRAGPRRSTLQSALRRTRALIRTCRLQMRLRLPATHD
jgi:hypothetical protein